MKFNGIYTPQAITKKAIDSHVSIEEVKRNLRFDDPTAAHADDEQLAELIEAAREAAENYTSRVFAYSEATFYAYNFSANTLRIDIAPFISIKSLRISTDNGTTFSTLTEGTAFNVLKQNTYFEIVFETGQGTSFDEIELKFYCGYASADMPPRVKQFIIVEASDGYDTDRTKYTYQVSDSQLQARILAPYILTRY